MLTELARTDDGSARYELAEEGEVCRFTIERRGPFSFACTGITWRVHERDGTLSPFERPGDWEVTSLCHEADWLRMGLWARTRCLRAAVRGAHRENRRRHHDRQLRAAENRAAA